MSPTFQMTFTPEQIAAIEAVIDARLVTLGISLLPPVSRPVKNYHTVDEIRALIRLHLDEIVGWFRYEEFDIATFRYFLARKTTMRPGDLEITNPRHQSTTRWDAQVLAAISQVHSPIVSTGKRRQYRIAHERVIK